MKPEAEKAFSFWQSSISLPENAIVTGEAFFEGEDMIRMKRRQLDKIRGARISYVPQGSGNGLNPLLTVGFQVAEPMIEHQKIGKKKPSPRR